jgi:hypothetical protein
VSAVAILEVVTQHATRAVEKLDLGRRVNGPTDNPVASIEDVRLHRSSGLQQAVNVGGRKVAPTVGFDSTEI